mmetsp:Transcript_8408/g.20162  ORF Transcript_8408/g.20162 Transcript_8408/m.20162 type:complete len:107 (-) Transcript_8408:522-842(-)
MAREAQGRTLKDDSATVGGGIRKREGGKGKGKGRAAARANGPLRAAAPGEGGGCSGGDVGGGGSRRGDLDDRRGVVESARDLQEPDPGGRLATAGGLRNPPPVEDD